jgi:hypothetical protein
MSKSLEKQLALTGASTDVNSVFSLHALTARKLAVPPRNSCCIAEVIAVIQSMLSKS